LFEDALAPVFQCAIALLIVRRELPDQFVKPLLPSAALVKQVITGYEPLKSRVGT
jgi:hypothetical protein